MWIKRGAATRLGVVGRFESGVVTRSLDRTPIRRRWPNGNNRRIRQADNPPRQRCLQASLGPCLGPELLGFLDERLDHVLLCGMIPGHDGPCWLRRTEIDRLVGYARRHEDKITRLAHDFVLQRGSPASEDGSLKHVDSGFVTQVQVRLRAPPGGMTTRCMDSVVALTVCPEIPMK